MHSKDELERLLGHNDCEPVALMIASAEFSPDRVYRYCLRRVWDASPLVMLVGLNPSTADETQDDPTIRRCMGFARGWG